jgi:predicted enzyme related to lactoylglutathione lyase
MTTPRRHFDHIDLRVPHLAHAVPFYEALLPAVGFTRKVDVEGWLQFETEGEGIHEFFGVTESPRFTPNENRIAFWAASAAAVDEVARVAVRAGARNVEGPMNYETGYYAVFFEDPWGNRLEVCSRDRNAPPSPT